MSFGLFCEVIAIAEGSQRVKANKLTAFFSVFVLLLFVVLDSQCAVASPTQSSDRNGVTSSLNNQQTQSLTSAHSILDLVFSGLTAIGTLCASILALFGPRIRSFFIRPILEFRADQKCSPLVEKLERIEDSSGENRKYYEIRIEIANKGRDAARNCRARVNAIYKQKPGMTDYFPLKEFVPRYLYWAKKDTRSEESLDVLPKLPEYVVVGRLTEHEKPIVGAQSQSVISATDFGLEVAVEPEGAKGKFCFIGRGKIILPFLVYADNLRSYEQQYVEIFWDGRSIDDYGVEHFSVKLIIRKDGDALVRRAK